MNNNKVLDEHYIGDSMTDKDKILEFLQFDDRTVSEVSYLLDLGEQFGIKVNFFSQLQQFEPRITETLPIFYKRMFLGELSWKLTELVCAEYYPEVAINRLEDFMLFFQDIWLDDEPNSTFFNYFIVNDLRDKSKREIVEDFYKSLEDTFKTFFEDPNEKTVLELNQKTVLELTNLVDLIRTGKI